MNYLSQVFPADWSAARSGSSSSGDISAVSFAVVDGVVGDLYVRTFLSAC